MSSTDTPLYQQPDAATADRVSDLLDRMTTAEKVGQLIGTWGGQLVTYQDEADLKQRVIEDHIGSVAAFGWAGSLYDDVGEIVPGINELQRVAVEETRLGVPLLIPLDAVHGHAYVDEGTVFPNGLGIAATFDRELVERAGRITAREMRATGAHQNYSPTCDVARDQRWGRTFETFGESPTVCAELAAAQVRGYQEGPDDEAVLATAKHFPAYSEPERGEDGSVVEVSQYTLDNVFTRPFARCIEAGVASIMPSYASVNGHPAHGSRWLLTDVLRDELGFEGHVVADWGGVAHLDREHRVTRDRTASVRRTFEAGLTISSTGTDDQVDRLVELVESDAGELTASWLDETAGRVLRAKFDLGLFEDPYVERETAETVVGAPAHQEATRAAARDSITLLEHDGLLPLSGDEDVLVTGPNADNLVHQLGGWSVTNPDVDGTTVREGIADATDGEVTHVQGTGINDALDVEGAAAAAANADVAVVVLGEHWYIHEFGLSATEAVPTGEFPTRRQLTLPEPQRRLAQAVHETGTPTVGVLISGRPLATPWLSEHLPELLMAYYPGSQGGAALADLLFGEASPSGRLPISVPRDVGDLPVRFNYYRHPRPLGPDEHPSSYDPLYEFGHGHSYTDVEYRDVSLVDAPSTLEDTVTVSATVANVGAYDTDERLLLYVTDRTLPVVVPDRELVEFRSVAVEAGESVDVSFELPVRALLPRTDRAVAPATLGPFELSLGEHVVSFDVGE